MNEPRGDGEPSARHCPVHGCASRAGEILDAAVAVIAERGFQGARIAHIAARAGLSTGHLYNFFDGKAAIVQALIRRETERHEVRFSRIASTRELIEAIVDEIERSTDPHRRLPIQAVRLQIAAAAAHEPGICQVLEESVARLKRRVAALLRDEHTRLGLQPPPGALEARVELVAALFDGMVLRSQCRAPSVCADLTISSEPQSSVSTNDDGTSPAETSRVADIAARADVATDADRPLNADSPLHADRSSCADMTSALRSLLSDLLDPQGRSQSRPSGPTPR